MEISRQAIHGLVNSYSPETKKWKQAHTQAAYVIMQFILQNQKTEVISVQTRGNDDFYIDVNRTNLMKEGVVLIKNLLHAIQVYKSLGAEKLGRQLYEKYSLVDKAMLQIRDRIKERSEAQVLNLYPGLRMQKDKKGNLFPTYQFYDYNIEGIIKSHDEKLPFSESMYNSYVKEWNKYKAYIRVPFQDGS